MARYPTLPLHTDAWLADTREMTLPARGAYIDLLIYAWRSPDCCLPDDDGKLARMLGISRYQWSRIKPEVMAFWTLEPVDKSVDNLCISVDNLCISVWRQKNLTRNREKIAKKSAINSAAAKRRWNGKSLKNKDSPDANAYAK